MTRRAGALPKPDKILVYDFAVTPADLKLDGGLASSLAREMRGNTQSDEEVLVGRKVADALARNLVDELNEMGIVAARGRGRVVSTASSVSLIGEFLSIDEGNRAARTLIGFGLGATELRTRVQAWQGGRLVAEAETASKSGLKPGMAATLGAGAAMGTLATAAAVSGGATVASEVFSATVEADAKRTAHAIAQQIRDAYLKRGWLPRDR